MRKGLCRTSIALLVGFVSLASLAIEVTIEPIVVSGDPVPGLEEGVVFDEFIFGDIYSVDQGGTLLFKALVEGEGVTEADRETLWFYDRSQLTLVARSDEPLPEIGLQAAIESILVDDNNGAPSIGRYGAFRSTISGHSPGPRLGDGAGAWGVVDGRKTLLAKTGDRAPEAPFGSLFRNVWAFPRGDGEFHLFAITAPSESQAGSNWRSGLWSVFLSEDPAATSVGLPGQPIEGTPLRTLDQLFWFLWIDLVPPYSPVLHTVAVGPGVDEFSDEVLLTFDHSGLTLLLREGDPIVTGNGTVVYGGNAGVTSMWNLMTSQSGDALFQARIGQEFNASALVLLRNQIFSVLARFDQPAPGILTEWWSQDGGEFLADGSLVVVGRVADDRLAIWRENQFSLVPTFVGETALVGPFSEFVIVRRPRFRRGLADGRVIVEALVSSDTAAETRALLTIGLEGDATALVVIGQSLRSSSGSYLTAGASVPPVVSRFELLGADDDGRVSAAIEFVDGTQGVFGFDVTPDAVFVDAFETGMFSRWTTVGPVGGGE